MRSFFARALTVVAVLGAAACLPDERPIQARQLYQGRDVENLRFATVKGTPYVSFDVRKRRPDADRSGVIEWRLAAWADATPLVMIPDRSDAWPMSTQDEMPKYPSEDPYANLLEVSDRLYYAMRDEQPADPAAGIPRTGTLVIFTFAGIREQIPFVESYVTSGVPGVFFYRRPAPGRAAPDLVLRDGKGHERVLQDVTGNASFYGETGLMFLGGADRTLYRMRSIDAPLEPLRVGVGNYTWVDGARMILGVSDQGKPVNTLFTVASRRERRLPGDAICCLLGGRGDRYWYVEAATPSKQIPARLHFYDLDRGDDQVLSLPPELADVSRIIDRPRPGPMPTALLVDSRQTLATIDLAANPPVTVVPLAAINPTFTRDGARLLYLEAEHVVPEPEGRLMSTDLVNPPVALSPAGALVQRDSFFEIGDEQRQRIVFWARYGRTVSDLYFVPPEGGAAEVVAQKIRDVSVGLHGYLGIVNASLQDLTGDLVRKDFDTGEVHVYSNQVESYAQLGDEMAFYVWNRTPASPDGVWAVSASSP